MSDLLESALRYASLGWHVFPCAKRGKTPTIGRGCRAASSDPAKIREWWSKTPDANIGMACGPRSGVYAVDIDVSEAKGVNGFESLSEPMPDTIESRTPSGGAHYLFTAGDKPPANKNSLRPGIDIRGDGYYVILPPSIHPNGDAYRWQDGRSPWEIEPAPYPDELRPSKELPPWARPRSAKPINGTTRDAVPLRASSTAPNIRDRAIAYLQTCEPAVQGFAGHDKLLWAARAMVRGFMLPESEAVILLSTHYNPRCTPPWDLTNPKDARDFTRKVREAITASWQKPDGWLLDEQTISHDSAAADRIAEALLASTPDEIDEEEDVDDEAPAPALAEIINPPGLVGEICKWINATALKDQPLLSLAASLTFCGAIMGRKVRDQWDNRTNLYSLSVGESSAGKGHARKQIKRLIEAAGIEALLGGEDVTSDAAIEKRMEQQPTTFFLWDEIGHLMQSIRANGSNPHLAKVLPTLMKLYSASGEVYIGKEYATAESRRIDQPCCCLYGTTTPDKLASGISPDEIKDGFLGRVLVFISETNPPKDYERAQLAPIVPEALAARIRRWWELAVVDQSQGDILQTTRAHQVAVPTDKDAHRRLMELEELADYKQISPKSKAKGIDRLWGKAGENARKIALIVACGDNEHEPRITLKHADYACKLVVKLIEDLARYVALNIAESIFEKDKQYIVRLVKEHGLEGISKRELTRRTQKFDSRQRDSYLRDLLDADEIVVVTKGNKTHIYPFPYGLPPQSQAHERPE